MNKLFTKIAALALGMTMATGVGVAVATSSKANSVDAATETGYAEPGSGGKFSEAGWSNSGLGSKYADGSAKFDSNGDNIYKTDLFSGTVSSNMTSLQVDVQYKINGTGAAANSVTIAPYVNSSYQTGTTQTGFSSTSKTTKSVTVSSGLAGCTGFKLTYGKSSGNLGVYKVSWTATYSGQTTYTVTIAVNNSDYGSVNKTSITSVSSGTSISSNSNVLTVGTNTVTATATTSTPQFTYAFSSWSGIPAGGTVTANVTVTANFTRTTNPVSSLAITGSMTKTTYTQGEAWDPTGFTVNAYYSGSPSTPVNVTSNVEWSYSPATTASTSTTSVTCTASFGGKSATSSAQSVTINEKQNLGGLVSGEKYFIIANGRYLGAFNSAPGAPAGTSKAWPGDESAPTSDDDAWLFTGTSTDDNWIITSKAGNTLYATATNNGLGCTSSGNDNWTVHDTANGLKITASNGRYLTQYNQSNFLVYTSTTGQTEADSTVRFVKYEAPATIESVEFTGDMTNKQYYVGDSWNYSGINLQANKSDETSEDLGAISALITAGDLEIEASPAAPGNGVTSVTISGVYGDDLLEAEITITGITVSTPRSITGVAITGDMTNKSYTAGDPWNYAGLNMTVTYDQGQPDVVALTTAVSAGDIEFTPNPATATIGTTSLTLGNIEHISFEGEISDKVITGITVAAVPGRINFGTTSGYWNPTASGATFTDNLGNSVQITSNSGAAYTQQGSDYKQVGTNNNAATEVTITITLSEKAGIDALSIKYAGAATRSNHTVSVYGDSVDDVILNGSISGSSEHEQSTDQSYTKINATSITAKFTANVADCGGIKIFYISYTLGSQVQEFGTLASIEVSSSSLHETVFEVDHTFSTEGLIITATDTVGFKKDFTTGFTTDYDGVTFDETAEDLEVTVTMTIGLVTKTTSYYIDVIEIPSYSLASSQDDLYEGTHVIVAYVENDNVYTVGSLSGSYFSKADGSKDGTDILAGEGTIEFVVEYYGSNILLRHGASFLKHSGDKSVTLVSEIDESCVWTYDGESLQNVSHDTYYFQYNKTSPRFTDYTGTQSDVGLYISSATPKTNLMGAATYAQKYLHMRDYTVADGSCMNDSANHYYSTAKTQYGNLTSGEKTEFAGLTDAVARLQAWARANGETFDPSTGFGNSNNRINPAAVLGFESTNAVAVIIIVSLISAAAVGGYFFIRKRKEN